MIRDLFRQAGAISDVHAFSEGGVLGHGSSEFSPNLEFSRFAIGLQARMANQPEDPKVSATVNELLELISMDRRYECNLKAIQQADAFIALRSKNQPIDIHLTAVLPASASSALNG